MSEKVYCCDCQFLDFTLGTPICLAYSQWYRQCKNEPCGLTPMVRNVNNDCPYFEVKL